MQLEVSWSHTHCIGFSNPFMGGSLMHYWAWVKYNTHKIIYQTINRCLIMQHRGVLDLSAVRSNYTFSLSMPDVTVSIFYFESALSAVCKHATFVLPIQPGSKLLVRQFDVYPNFTNFGTNVFFQGEYTTRTLIISFNQGKGVRENCCCYEASFDIVVDVSCQAPGNIWHVYGIFHIEFMVCSGLFLTSLI